MDEVLVSPVVSDPLHILEICAVSDGAASLVLGHGGAGAPSRRAPGALAGCATATRQFGDPSARIPSVGMPIAAGSDHTSEVVGAVRRAMAMAGVAHADVDLIELADNTAWHLLAWPGCSVPAAGRADRLLETGGILPSTSGCRGVQRLPVLRRATTAQGDAAGHCELAWQLRGEATGARCAMRAWA